STSKYHAQPSTSAGSGIDRADFVAELPQIIAPARQYNMFREEQNPVLDIAPGVTAMNIARNFEYTTAHLLNGISEDSDSLAVKHQPRSKSAHDMLDEPFEFVEE
ncbi:unnamed protein product, partial [Mesorhabditis spiculigera]